MVHHKSLVGPGSGGLFRRSKASLSMHIPVVALATVLFSGALAAVDEVCSSSSVLDQACERSRADLTAFCTNDGSGREELKEGWAEMTRCASLLLESIASAGTEQLSLEMVRLTSLARLANAHRLYCATHADSLEELLGPSYAEPFEQFMVAKEMLVNDFIQRLVQIVPDNYELPKLEADGSLTEYLKGIKSALNSRQASDADQLKTYLEHIVALEASEEGEGEPERRAAALAEIARTLCKSHSLEKLLERTRKQIKGLYGVKFELEPYVTENHPFAPKSAEGKKSQKVQDMVDNHIESLGIVYEIIDNLMSSCIEGDDNESSALTKSEIQERKGSDLPCQMVSVGIALAVAMMLSSNMLSLDEALMAAAL